MSHLANVLQACCKFGGAAAIASSAEVDSMAACPPARFARFAICRVLPSCHHQVAMQMADCRSGRGMSCSKLPARSRLLVASIPVRSALQVAGLRFDQLLEFDEGDAGHLLVLAVASAILPCTYCSHDRLSSCEGGSGWRHPDSPGTYKGRPSCADQSSDLKAT